MSAIDFYFDFSSPYAYLAQARIDQAAADAEALSAAIDGDVAKARLKAETDAAIERGVFGAPFFMVDGEPFWGVDSLDDAMRWAACGGW